MNTRCHYILSRGFHSVIQTRAIRSDQSHAWQVVYRSLRQNRTTSWHPALTFQISSVSYIGQNGSSVERERRWSCRRLCWRRAPAFWTTSVFMCSKESQVGSFYTIESFHTKSRPPQRTSRRTIILLERPREWGWVFWSRNFNFSPLGCA